MGGSWLEKRSQKPETRTELPQETAETMEVDGVTYRRRTDLTTILVMGIDHDSEIEAEGSYQGGQADFQRLIVIDSKTRLSVSSRSTATPWQRLRCWVCWATR